MAELSITAANVVPQSNAIIDRTRIAGEAVTAGQPGYISTADGKAYKADSNASLATAVVYGIFVSGGAANQPVALQTGGDLAFGAILTANTGYVVGATAGSIAPIADVTTGWSLGFLGVAISTSVLRLGIINTGVQS